jgi:hypothetical protein
MEKSLEMAKKSSPLPPVSNIKFLVSVIALGFTVGIHASENPIAVQTISELRGLDMTGITNRAVALALGYYNVGDRGGGTFQWNPSSTEVDDGGGTLTNSLNRVGRWKRVLIGEVPNIRMWGAKGNWWWNAVDTQAHDDTAAITNAIKACYANSCAELLFPQGTYKVTDTIVFDRWLHLRGENAGRCTLKMPVGIQKDILRTANANKSLKGELIDWDHELIVENLRLAFDGTESDRNTNNAALVICRPGEAHSIRNVLTFNGAFGIRCLGVGAPGLKVRDCSFFGSAIAGISVEGLVLANGTTWDVGGIVSLIGISGDNRYSNTATNASLFRFHNCRPTVSIADFKAEASWAGGLISYHIGPAGTRLDVLGSLTIRGGTWNGTENLGFPLDLVVLKGGTPRTASVLIDQPVNLYNVRYLIRDEVTGRNIDSDVQIWSGLAQTVVKMPTAYEGHLEQSHPDPDNGQKRSQLVIGQTAFVRFLPPETNRWYRIIAGFRSSQGKLVVSAGYEESAEFHFRAFPGGTNSATIDVTRHAKYRGTLPPPVTKARSGVFRRNSADWPYVDIYVERVSATNRTGRITVSYDLNGTDGWIDGIIPLLAPTIPVSSALPPGNTASSGEISLVEP